MNEEVARAINNLSKRMTDMERKLEAYLLMKHDENASNIQTNDEAIQDLAELVSAMNPEE